MHLKYFYDLYKIFQRKQSWEVTAYHNAWIRGLTAGGCGKDPYQGTN
jgi:hypothetical protein